MPMPDITLPDPAFAIRDDEQYQPTEVLADQHVRVPGPAGGGLLLCHASRGVDMPHSSVDRLVIDGGALLLEVSPAAMAQGANRYDRGVNYHEYIMKLARGEGLESEHRLIQLNGVGHSAGDVMADEKTRKVIFG